MDKKYFSKLIARDQQGLSLISAYCSESDVRISNIKYLKQNKIFLISITRFKKETEKDNLVKRTLKKILSVND